MSHVLSGSLLISSCWRFSKQVFLFAFLISQECMSQVTATLKHCACGRCFCSTKPLVATSAAEGSDSISDFCSRNSTCTSSRGMIDAGRARRSDATRACSPGSDAETDFQRSLAQRGAHVGILVDRLGAADIPSSRWTTNKNLRITCVSCLS